MKITKEQINSLVESIGLLVNMAESMDYEEEPNDDDKSIIIKASNPVKPKRATYYLFEETIEKINTLSEQTGVGKSELVDRLLNEAFDRLSIEPLD